MAQHVGVVAQVHRAIVAVRAGEVRGRGIGVDICLVLLAGDAGDGERDGRVRHVDDEVHALIVPLPCQRGADVGLVLVVALHHLDVVAPGRRAVVLHGEVHASHRGGAAVGLVGAGEVAAHRDLQRLARRPRAGEDGRDRQHAASHRGSDECSARDGHGLGSSRIIVSPLLLQFAPDVIPPTGGGSPARPAVRRARRREPARAHMPSRACSVSLCSSS